MGEHVWVESAVCATSSGGLTWENWPHDVAIALGLSGRRNPLGFAVVRFLSGSASSVEVWDIVLQLTTKLMDGTKLDRDFARECAWKGFEWWRDSRCVTCGGRGVVKTVQRTCPDCKGTGRRDMPSGPDAVCDAIGFLVDAEQWMEGQLAARLRRGG